ncbi:Thiamine kinase [Roseovarius nanhaiticus]|uniref:Thiamine kinase n=1 Tax=Roseovarius nanhaiticus TaxID=573024 RepID=A0A1N7GAP4_9RHOB|nr:phosphotransferase [Roseovarius nanhaiticus]SEK32581.1 Thiamine kinase [Roseovarius nanhaiticus]SIS09596.1 Thiamine kinase [Roseovarius nanhaiticus]
MTPDDAIAAARALPCWSDVTAAAPLEGGITNHNIRVTDAGRDYVVRLGQDIPEHGILRWHELALSHAAADAGLSPPVRHHQEGALVIDYIPSTALTEEDLHDEGSLMQATDLVATLHRDLPKHAHGPTLAFWVFHILRSYAHDLRAKGSRHIPKLSGLLDEAEALERAVGPVQMVLGHNDLLPANILRADSRMWLIDWEYGGWNSPLFDLGGLASNAALPREAEKAMLARYYGALPGPELWRSYEAMKCASLLRETMWSMVSEQTSQIDFDYADYTDKNLGRYLEALAALKAQGHLT